MHIVAMFFCFDSQFFFHWGGRKKNWRNIFQFRSSSGVGNYCFCMGILHMNLGCFPLFIDILKYIHCDFYIRLYLLVFNTFLLHIELHKNRVFIKSNSTGATLAREMEDFPSRSSHYLQNIVCHGEICMFIRFHLYTKRHSWGIKFV